MFFINSSFISKDDGARNHWWSTSMTDAVEFKIKWMQWKTIVWWLWIFHYGALQLGALQFGALQLGALQLGALQNGALMLRELMHWDFALFQLRVICFHCGGMAPLGKDEWSYWNEAAFEWIEWLVTFNWRWQESEWYLKSMIGLWRVEANNGAVAVILLAARWQLTRSMITTPRKRLWMPLVDWAMRPSGLLCHWSLLLSFIAEGASNYTNKRP